MYNLTTSMSDRANLDEFAASSGYEDANAHYPGAIITGDALTAHANSLVDLALDNEDVTDDEEEYRARYVDSYTKAYTEQVTSRKQDEA